MDTWLEWYMTRIIFCIGTVTLVVCANTLRATSQTQVGAMFGMHAHGFCVPEGFENRRKSRLGELKIVQNGGLEVSLGGLGRLGRNLD